MYFCSRRVYFKELKIKLILLNFKHGVQRSHSQACSLKKCTLPYTYFIFKCLVLYFGIKKEWLEKSLNTFSLAANILLKGTAEQEIEPLMLLSTNSRLTVPWSDTNQPVHNQKTLQT